MPSLGTCRFCQTAFFLSLMLDMDSSHSLAFKLVNVAGGARHAHPYTVSRHASLCIFTVIDWLPPMQSDSKDLWCLAATDQPPGALSKSLQDMVIFACEGLCLHMSVHAGHRHPPCLLWSCLSAGSLSRARCIKPYRASRVICVCMCRGAQEELHIRIESGDSSVRGSQWPGALLCAAGWEPFSLVEHAVAVAGSLSGGAKPRRLKQLPPSLNAFGWCTWDAFYSTVSARGVVPPHSLACM